MFFREEAKAFSEAHRVCERTPVLKNALGWLIGLVVLPCIAAPMVSGDYEGLLIGVDRNGSLTGYFERSTEGGQFNCIFFVRGRLNGAIARVDTWSPGHPDPKEVIHGVLERSSQEGTPAIRLKLEKEHGGCWNVEPFASEPASLSLTEQGSWEAIRIIASKKAYFYDDPARPEPRKTYAVKGNSLRVFETRDGWVRAEYVSPKKKRTRGWVLERDLFSSEGPVVGK